MPGYYCCGRPLVPAFERSSARHHRAADRPGRDPCLRLASARLLVRLLSRGWDPGRRRRGGKRRSFRDRRQRWERRLGRRRRCERSFRRIRRPSWSRRFGGLGRKRRSTARSDRPGVPVEGANRLLDVLLRQPLSRFGCEHRSGHHGNASLRLRFAGHVPVRVLDDLLRRASRDGSDLLRLRVSALGAGRRVLRSRPRGVRNGQRLPCLRRVSWPLHHGCSDQLIVPGTLAEQRGGALLARAEAGGLPWHSLAHAGLPTRGGQ